jgi:phenylacetic acid degradation operon negative regulatory protein
MCHLKKPRDTLRNNMVTRASAVAADLVGRFRRQRPLRAGSLIVTIFGDSIMPRGGAIALGSLIPLASLFGLNERLVRTASARLAQEGWLAARRVGKRSEYRLSNGGRERFEEATERIYGDPAAEEASGRWTLIVLPPMAGAQRRRLRQELAWQGFGALGNGVFAHPQLPARMLAWQIREASLPDRTLVFEADLASPATPAPLVKLGWDLEALGKRYQRFVARFGLVEAALGARLEPQIGFIVRTLLIHEYRRLHLRDPLLPARLLPADWPGLKAAELCRSIYARVFAASEAHLSAVAAQLDGALPPAYPSILRRFGGFAADARG